jgi:hypothetical protein
VKELIGTFRVATVDGIENPVTFGGVVSDPVVPVGKSGKTGLVHASMTLLI